MLRALDSVRNAGELTMMSVFGIRSFEGMVKLLTLEVAVLKKLLTDGAPGCFADVEAQ